MEFKDKMDNLKSLKEDQLRSNVLIPLLSRMGFKAPMLYHGPNERGKDIIAFDYDKLGKKTYIAVVAKTGDLNGSSSDEKSLNNVSIQVRQCIYEPYYNVFSMDEVKMDQVWVVTNGRIVPGAENSIKGFLEDSKLSRFLRFISVEALVQLIDEHYPSYWDIAKETPEFVKGQRDRLVKFSKGLLESLGASERGIRDIETQLLNSEFIPFHSLVSNYKLTKVSAYSIELDKISDKYNHLFFTETVEDFRDIHFSFRKILAKHLLRMEEELKNYAELLKLYDPHEFQEGLRSQLKESYYISEQISDIFHGFDEYSTNLKEIDLFLNDLNKLGKLDWALTLFDSIEKSSNKIQKYLNTAQKQDFNFYWKITEVEGKEIAEFNYENEENSSFGVKMERQMPSYGRSANKEINGKSVIAESSFELYKYIDSTLLTGK
ncbi:hypothetical protein [Neobacillus vireti]|uniref:hypothetical protein n=1 Tax=Neobacillus vireti TaxID=220686 RepID=UPI00300023CE